MKNSIILLCLVILLGACSEEKLHPAQNTDLAVHNHHEFKQRLVEQGKSFDENHATRINLNNRFLESLTIIPYVSKKPKIPTNSLNSGYFLEFKNRRKVAYPMVAEFIGNEKFSNSSIFTGKLKVSTPQGNNIISFSIDGGIVVDKDLKLVPSNLDSISCDWEDIIYCFYENISIETSIGTSLCLPDWPLCIGERIADCYDPGC